MQVLLWVSSVLAALGFGLLLFLPRSILRAFSFNLVIWLVVTSSIGCGGLVLYGVLEQKQKLESK